MLRGFAGRITVTDTDAAVALLAPSLFGLDHEQFHVLHLGKDLGLIWHESYAAGSAGGVDVPLRRLFADALALESRALVLAHNHPGGDLVPSRADKAVTRRIVEIARPLEIRVLDHLIFGHGAWASFRRLGLM
ncbi:JAB domain-containing protein [Sphingomonas sp.]|uniref:JAB domain-containing protein n=1 Tax=Sphingomonas sp. TaxID=28214 RepID=UPI0025D4CB4B|nr:JAB domain-containing protein [Sphingomonas sp.]